MKSRVVLLAIILCARVSMGSVFYVSPTGNHQPPFDNSTKAATNIQDAVNLALDGDEVRIGDGHYILSSYVNITNNILVIGENGSEFTVVDGAGSTHGFNLANVDCVLSGMTITNGFNANGGGVYCAGAKPIITNCVVVGNMADDGGGVFGGRIYNSTITANFAGNYGGGVREVAVYNSVITENSAAVLAGGAYDAVICNSLVYSNQAVEYDGGAEECVLTNCTVVANSAGDTGGVGFCSLFNTVVYGNSSSSGDDVYIAGGTVMYSCSPHLTHGVNGNITNAPAFVDVAAGDYRLQPDSPCINAGNNTYAVGTTDLDGHARIFNAIVDMGAYESLSFAFSVSGQRTGVGFVLQWPTVASYDYHVLWTTDLTMEFVPLGPVITYPDNSYTDMVHAAEAAGFYKVEAQLQ